MRHAFLPLAGLVFTVLLIASPVAAQHEQIRKGFWIGFGPTYGSAGVSCDGCEEFERENSYGFFIKLGGTLNPRVLLGADFSVWTKDEEGVRSGMGNGTATVYFYPAVRSGLFLKGGIGSSVYLESDALSDLDVEGTGFGVTLGVGYDLRIGSNTSLTPVFDYLWGNIGDLEVSDGPAAGTIVAQGWSQDLFYLGLGITFH